MTYYVIGYTQLRYYENQLAKYTIYIEVYILKEYKYKIVRYMKGRQKIYLYITIKYINCISNHIAYSLRYSSKYKVGLKANKEKKLRKQSEKEKEKKKG